MVAHVCNLSYSTGRGRRIMSSRPAQEKVAVRPCLKNKRLGGVSQVVEHLSSKCEAPEFKTPLQPRKKRMQGGYLP
jgi:hypothetical protein